MEKRYELGKLLRNGKGFRITAFALLLIGAALSYAMGITDHEAGIGMFICIVLLSAVFFWCGASVSSSRKKTLDRLEENGELQSALDDYNAASTVKLDKNGRSAIGSKYLFALMAGRIYRYDEVLWVYITVNRSNGIPVSQLLYIRTIDGRQCSLVSEKIGRKGEERLCAYINAIVGHNPDCMVGYSIDNSRAYKAAVKAYKASR